MARCERSGVKQYYIHPKLGIPYHSALFKFVNTIIVA